MGMGTYSFFKIAILTVSINILLIDILEAQTSDLISNCRVIGEMPLSDLIALKQKYNDYNSTSTDSAFQSIGFFKGTSQDPYTFEAHIGGITILLERLKIYQSPNKYLKLFNTDRALIVTANTKLFRETLIDLVDELKYDDNYYFISEADGPNDGVRYILYSIYKDYRIQIYCNPTLAILSID